MATLTKPKAVIEPVKTLELKKYIDGRWVVGRGKREILSLNPADVRQTVAG